MEMTVTFDSNITEAHSSFTCRPSEAEIKEQKNQKQKQTTQRVVAFEREVQKIIIYCKIFLISRRKNGQHFLHKNIEYFTHKKMLI